MEGSEKLGEIFRDKTRKIESIARHFLEEGENSRKEILEWIQEIVERKGLEVLVDLLEGLGEVLRTLILIVGGSPIDFLPTLGDVHYLKVMVHEDGVERKLGPKGDVAIYCLPLHEGKAGKKVVGHICVALHIPTGRGSLWLLPNVVSAAASIESDLLAWRFMKQKL